MQKELTGEAFNFGPPANQNHNVLNVVEEMSKYWEKVKWQTNNASNFEESGLLKLNCDKALSQLSWEPVWNFNDTIYQTVSWYKNFYENKEDMLETSLSQISAYTNSAILKNYLGPMLDKKVIITPINKIKLEGGDIIKNIKVGDIGYKNFQETYYSLIKFGKKKVGKNI